jgi:hypothetical protein
LPQFVARPAATTGLRFVVFGVFVPREIPHAAVS